MKENNLICIPFFNETTFKDKTSKYCILIPVINEGEKIRTELRKMHEQQIHLLADIVICDGGSTDQSLEFDFLKKVGIRALLTKNDIGKQGAQLRIGFWWGIENGYDAFITVDGNNKDSVESIPLFIEKIKEGYDFVQGSRFIKGGMAINTPLLRYISVRLIHAPIISITAKYKFTDSTNAFRAYSKKYLEHEEVKPFRNIFNSYELLAYLSVRASQLHMNVCEVPVRREYPKGKIPTKISPLKGNYLLFKILILNFFGKYNP